MDQGGMKMENAKAKEESGIERLCAIMKRLRAPDGCPWDKVQTLETLKPCVLEETYELLAAMDNPGDKENYIEELGDVLLQIVFQSTMAEQEGRFTFNDVANAVSDKLVRRHPHVFGDVSADNPSAVLRNWELIKEQERKKKVRSSALDGVPENLPSLLKAQRSQEKAARVGFDWKEASGALEKVKEEIGEVCEAFAEFEAKGYGDSGIDSQEYLHLKEEFGDLIFAITNWARHLKVDAESALQTATRKFSRRFRAVESHVKESGKRMKDCSLEELDGIWNEIKLEEKRNG